MHRYQEKIQGFPVLVALTIGLMVTTASCLIAYDPCHEAYRGGGQCYDGGLQLPVDGGITQDEQDTGLEVSDTGTDTDTAIDSGVEMDTGYDGGTDPDTGSPGDCHPPCDHLHMCHEGECLLREPRIAITPGTAYLEVGESISLIVAATMENYPITPLVTWRSADESLVIVDQEGLIMALALGTTTITASTINGVNSAHCTVHVQPRYTIAEGRNRDDEASIYQRYYNPAEPLVVQVYDTVEMHGLGSTVPESEISTYRWQRCAQPKDSLSTLVTAPTPPSKVSFMIDVPGIYCFELEVYNKLGTQNPDKDRIWVRGM